RCHREGLTVRPGGICARHSKRIGEGDVMRDIMMDVYNALIDDEFISSNVQLIKFYEYPEHGSIDDPYIVIDEIDGELPMEYADNTKMAASKLIQVDVYVRNQYYKHTRITVTN